MEQTDVKKVGRPTKLNRELVDKADTYLDTCKDYIHETDKGTLAYVDVKLPTVVSLAIYLNIMKSTVYEWISQDVSLIENEETKQLIRDFSDIVKEVEQKQEERLISGSLGGKYNPKIAGMMMSKHGYVERKDVTSDGAALFKSNVRDLPEDELARLANQG